MNSKKSFDYRKRLDSLIENFKQWDVDGCVIESLVDLYYLTGLLLSRGRLVVSKHAVTLFVDGRYLLAAKEQSIFSVALFSSETFKDGTFAFDSATTSYDQADKLKAHYLHLKPIAGLLRLQRGIKDPMEIQLMEESAALSWKGFEHLQSQIKPGVSEETLAWEYERFCREKGASALAFDPIVAFGSNTAKPHHRSGSDRLQPPQAVLCDLGIVYERYRSDMTRTFSVGDLNPKLQELQKVVAQAFEAALNLCRPGTPIGALDRAARNVMSLYGVEELFVHSLGHGIGLQTHEFPSIREYGPDASWELQPGMVITIEPGLYLPGVGGVRHEDTIVITQKGYRSFYV